AALATGGLLVNWVGLARAMARVSSASAYTEFHQATNRTFDPYMPIVVFGALFAGIALAVVSSERSERMNGNAEKQGGFVISSERSQEGIPHPGNSRSWAPSAMPS